MLHFTLVIFLALFGFTALINGCGGVSDPDEKRQQGVGKRNSANRGKLDVDKFAGKDDELNFDGESEENSSGSGASPFTGDPLDKQGNLNLDQAVNKNLFEPLKQKGISNTIDFLFIIDASKENPYTTSPKLKEKLSLLPLQLNSLEIQWRLFFLNADVSEDSKSRNGKLMNLEYNEGIIRSQYLDNDIAAFYENQVSEIFIDTIEHDTSRKCELPPYCHNKKHSRPLKAFYEFLMESQYILRKNADLFVIIITNQDETQPKSSKEQPLEASQVVDRFKSINPNKKIYAASIVVKAGDEKCKEENKNNITASYVPQISMLTNGLIINICSVQDNGYSAPIIDWIETMKETSQ